jgi:ELP3 family radical SAM enzyme/protein acetyltransferase
MDIEDIIQTKTVTTLTEEQITILKKELIKNTFDTTFNLIRDIKKEYKFNCSKIDLIKIYSQLGYEDYELKKKLIKKIQKSQSGIISVTVLTSGTPEYTNANGERIKGTFSCLHNCSFCPNEKPSVDNNWTQQPKSYLYTEPAVLRANHNDFDPIKQMNSRISSLSRMGHQIDKIELLVLGGTWSEYPKEYQDEFITKLYYAANTYYDDIKREILSLEEEITNNEIANIHIIGLTLEMRSDSITLNEIQRLRRFNCTRVQLGIQHTNNEILKMNNRGESVEKTKQAIKLLKNNCYKIDGHLMLNLYGSSVEKDEIMLNEILYNPDLQLDQLKIYPCAVVPFTKIKELFDTGVYKPYDDSYLYTLIKNFKINIPKQFRINRIIRDISGHYIQGGYSQQFTSIRQVLEKDMKINNWKCKCIRCREIKGNKIDEDINLDIIEYKASDGIEYFISFETTKYLIGFIRLRLNFNEPNCKILPILHNTALIRELHVYSTLSNVGNNDDYSFQHKGYGSRLIEKAEEIAKSFEFKRIAIIAGTGVRNYYKKFGYNLLDTFMIKNLD